MILNNKGQNPLETLNEAIKKLNLYHKPDDADGRALALELLGRINFCLEFGLIAEDEWETLCEKMVFFLYGD